jgi:hypothetical protein
MNDRALPQIGRDAVKIDPLDAASSCGGTLAQHENKGESR